SGPPQSDEEQLRLTRTLHALDHASRLAEVASEKTELASAPGACEDARARELCAEAMRNAVVVADEVDTLPDDGASTEPAMVQLEHCANALRELRGAHRKMTLSAVAGGAVNADEAMARVDTVRRLDALAHHAWRSSAHLVASGA